ncbi:hypothetical protein AB0885_39910 [Streptomyces sp. NPDC005534]
MLQAAKDSGADAIHPGPPGSGPGRRRSPTHRRGRPRGGRSKERCP